MYFRIILVAAIFIICTGFIFGAEIDDPAMKFYLDKADSVLNSSTLFNNNLQYSVSATSIYDKINYRGITDESDTTGFLIDFDNLQFVISQIIDTVGLEENTFPSDIQFEKPWELNCRFYFFPRDTGAGDLAIGFAPVDSLRGENPEGLIIINRDTYQIKSLYLHYLAFDEYEWMSREYQFSYENEIALLKSLTIQGCYFGFFQLRYFRQDILFKNYDLQ